MKLARHKGSYNPLIMLLALVALAIGCLWLWPRVTLSAAPAQPPKEDIMKMVEARRVELDEKEKTLKIEEERLAALRKDVDEKVALFTRLLADIEAALKRVEVVKDEKLDVVVKAYDTMTAEEAAARLSALDDAAALKILVRMKSKKMSSVMATLPPAKAAAFTKGMTTVSVKSGQ